MTKAQKISHFAILQHSTQEVHYWHQYNHGYTSRFPWKAKKRVCQILVQYAITFAFGASFESYIIMQNDRIA